MAPSLAAGDWVWARATPGHLPQVGAIVVVADPQHPTRLLVKRVRSRSTQMFYVGSDNPLEGRDSRHFGSLPPTNLRATALLRIALSPRLRVEWLGQSA